MEAYREKKERFGEKRKRKRNKRTNTIETREVKRK